MASGARPAAFVVLGFYCEQHNCTLPASFAAMAEKSLFSQAGLELEPTQGASQAAFDFSVTESQLNTQVDFSFLDWGQTQPDGATAGAFDDFGDLGLHGASQVRAQEPDCPPQALLPSLPLPPPPQAPPCSPLSACPRLPAQQGMHSGYLRHPRRQKTKAAQCPQDPSLRLAEPRRRVHTHASPLPACCLPACAGAHIPAHPGRRGAGPGCRPGPPQLPGDAGRAGAGGRGAAGRAARVGLLVSGPQGRGSACCRTACCAALS